ncbi:glucose transporter GlcU [Bacillus pseudomycoides]|uniref:Glucose transporter GlcU n=1 Tax=Bacillus pseudomycoides TaxID=64104 RepID=A0AA91VBW0_9BACI|nr:MULTISPECIES: GRP family sugar transporter [Bacillus]PEB55500.1 glucose transporter GlcU [Bacillus sp. AFS098217]PED82154.1 glucose transporter GlcU [Bacillus pseudomycoides]PEU10201.1 glucose transporter GlcU [Bacillus sp. AFS019443]PEU19058.1 glucose transporter GlcU [Bacillus sp. AFS014408]PFW64661.1 glucose transporter GlcU [Bacillus sp. AFS075034]
MDILLALLPAIAWGNVLLVSVKMGGGAYSQTVGMTIGALFFASIMFAFTQPTLTLTVLIVGFISGIFWALGQVNQLKTVETLGVSTTVTISTGMQLVATSIFGVIVFHEWTTTTTIILGTIAILLIVVGVVFTSLDDKENAQPPGQFKKGILTLILSTFGYLVYVIIIRWYNIDGWAAILPQAVGMFAGAVLLTAKHKPFNKYAIRNILSGLLWGTGNLFLFLSQPKVGVATSFSLSQTGIVISTFGAIVFLGEKKTKRQMVFIALGSVLIIGGAVLLGLTKK